MTERGLQEGKCLREERSVRIPDETVLLCVSSSVGFVSVPSNSVPSPGTAAAAAAAAEVDISRTAAKAVCWRVRQQTRPALLFGMFLLIYLNSRRSINPGTAPVFFGLCPTSYLRFQTAKDRRICAAPLDRSGRQMPVKACSQTPTAAHPPW